MAVKVWYKDGDVSIYDRAKDFVVNPSGGITLIDARGIGYRVGWINFDVVELILIVEGEDDDTGTLDAPA